MKESMKPSELFCRALATFAVCGMGGWCMYITDGATGVGWAILGVLFIWVL